MVEQLAEAHDVAENSGLGSRDARRRPPPGPPADAHFAIAGTLCTLWAARPEAGRKLENDVTPEAVHD
ncbi:hypothetical protein TCAP_06090 [Tolypocladium capitatum]|uniref:Uncharacterized protein n=1 Tax=Tolypocladium capitatum TaxID=45235 RepID=A0A2K3Q8V8_9HYPO|nr:hypothetical protein TCAP_06090 [Tolypocladium capitatum]